MTAALPEPVNAPLTRTLSTVKKPSPGAMNTHNTEPTHSASGHGKAQLYYGLHIKWPLSSSAGSCILVDQMCDELFQGILQTHPKLRTLDLVGGVYPAIPPACMELGVHHKDTMQASNATLGRSTQEADIVPGPAPHPSPTVAPYPPASSTNQLREAGTQQYSLQIIVPKHSTLTICSNEQCFLRFEEWVL